MKHGSLFSGIGGFDLAAEWMGWENVFHCEWNEFGQKVLNHYWPNAESFTDITKSDFTKYANTIDILTGGFPCQPYSLAGKRKGKEDERHLWPEMLRAIREISPRWVVGENVRGLTNWNGGMVFDEVQADLETEGYEVLPFLLPACAVNAPHRRDRIWFIAYAVNNGRKDISRNIHGKTGKEQGERAIKQQGAFNKCETWITPNTNNSLQPVGLDTTGNSTEATGSEGGNREQGETSHRQRVWAKPRTSGKDATNASNQGLQGRSEIVGNIRGSRQERNEQFAGLLRTTWQEFPTVTPLCNGDDGISAGLDTNTISFSRWRNESIKAGGNAIVPQVACEIFKAIQSYEAIRP
jgi:DNA (cytosine-5)-methyltransferase 1